MATIDMRHKTPRYRSKRAFIEIRPSTQGAVNVGDTIEVSGGWLWTVAAMGEPFQVGEHTEVRVWLRDERPAR